VCRDGCGCDDGDEGVGVGVRVRTHGWVCGSLSSSESEQATEAQ